ncbi:MAG TPA: tRNA pseudouridine(55) synthase TruB [Thermoanaerobaculia bacterium]|jgi:tRNA pseudouridine55 synthase|nr:tRNA pseudouridine(55) synthase TruB [Thermoanaerobaculia bacterium]
MKDGLLLVDKEAGLTSHDIVQKVRRLLKQKKIGHCGTLDPDATGLLLLTLGTATRLTRFLIRAPKVYEGVFRLGIATDTYDASGRTVSEAPPEAMAALTREAVAAAMHAFEGEIEQKPPPYSAKKVNGVKYYELARRGEEVPDEAKEVTVYELAPLGDLDDGRIAFRLACSSGTYARGLAHDLGAALGVGGHLAALRRTKIGSFSVDAAVTLAGLEAAVAAGEAPGQAWIPFDQIPLPFGEVTADPQQETRISHGQTVLVRELSGEEGDWVKLINRRREMIAVGTVVERIGTAGVGIVQPRVVFR